MLYAVSSANPGNATYAKQYFDRGIIVNTTRCEEYLRYLINVQTGLEFWKEYTLLSGVLTTGVLGIADVGGDAIEAVALSTAFIADSVDLARDKFLLGPAPEQVSKLIERSLSAYVEEARRRSSDDWEVA